MTGCTTGVWGWKLVGGQATGCAVFGWRLVVGGSHVAGTTAYKIAVQGTSSVLASSP